MIEAHHAFKQHSEAIISTGKWQLKKKKKKKKKKKEENVSFPFNGVRDKISFSLDYVVHVFSWFLTATDNYLELNASSRELSTLSSSSDLRKREKPLQCE